MTFTRTSNSYPPRRDEHRARDDLARVLSIEIVGNDRIVRIETPEEGSSSAARRRYMPAPELE